ncbi:hypothetical protein F2P81_020593 [Scophthalmus maximus]|uniref:Sulfotransferase n=1 Tax=Scophthalmus maximus TaxID=52904 RepID=A0A6A4SAT5_SCOMX|nr:hypothetical protein F2P81_020593 [Scophthalmus maximus]
MQSRMQLANQISDEEKLYRHNGVLYPRIMCPEDNLKALENFQAREDDVVLVAYPKCARGSDSVSQAPGDSPASRQHPRFLPGKENKVSWGSYFDHALAWEKKMDDPDVMIVTYEELKQDLSDGVRQISGFFGFGLTEAQVQQIADESTFSAMKQSAADSHGNMGNVIFRKGEVGDWRNHFTPEQSREMDDAFAKHLAGTRLGEKLNYRLHCQ